MNVNLKFVFDIIDSHLAGYESNYEHGLMITPEYIDKTEALKLLRQSLLTFIEESKKL